MISFEMLNSFIDKNFFKLCIKSSVVGVVVSLTVWDKICYFSGVDGVSMQPLINSKGCYTKDRVFIVRSSIFKPVEGTIQRGDVVSLISPKKYDECYIKRVVGLPGDVVKTISYKKDYVLVPEGQCWIEGDNHRSSYDSNKFGCIPMSLILGKAKVLKQPIEFENSLAQYIREFFKSFSLIKSQLPESRSLIRLKAKNVSNDGMNYFVDYKCKKLPDGFEEVVNGELSEEVFNEIFDYEDDSLLEINYGESRT